MVSPFALFPATVRGGFSYPPRRQAVLCKLPGPEAQDKACPKGVIAVTMGVDYAPRRTDG